MWCDLQYSMQQHRTAIQFLRKPVTKGCICCREKLLELGMFFSIIIRCREKIGLIQEADRRNTGEIRRIHQKDSGILNNFKCFAHSKMPNEFLGTQKMQCGMLENGKIGVEKAEDGMIH